MTDLPALIAHLEAGESVDWASEKALPWPPYTKENVLFILACQGNIGAAIAFTEAVLPGCRLIMSRGQNYASAAIVKGWGAKKQCLAPTEESASDEDLPRLVVLATLKAVKEKTE